MIKRILASLTLTGFAALLSIAGLGGCFGSGGSDEFSSGDCSGGFCGSNQIDVSVDVSDAQALFTVQSDASASSGLTLNDKNLTYGSESPLYAVTDTGVKGILTALDPTNTNSNADLPRVSLVAVSPTNRVFLVFEHPWTYCNTTSDGTTIEQYSDPWSPSSPFTCQIFMVSEAVGSDVTDSDLICLDSQIEINTWDERTKGVQFDEDGNVYYAAHVFGNWKDLVYKYSPSLDTTAASVSAKNVAALKLKNAEDSTDSSADFTFEEKLCADYTAADAARTELINANICFERFLVTETGGVLYTGVTATGGECHGGGGEPRFRYITPAGELQQITSGWWDYTFAPIEENLENGTADNSYFNGQILFYGPDPTIATSAGWDDSCLYRYDPSETGAEASTKIADCNIDIWQYINFDDDGNPLTDADRKTNCEATKTMMGGGNQPDKILMADNQEWRATGGAETSKDGLSEIYVVGDIFEKEANEWRCDVCANDNGADTADVCTLANGNLDLTKTTSSDCTTAGGTWTENDANDWKCWNNQVASSTTGSVCTEANLPSATWTVNSTRCEFEGNSGRDTRSALSRVDVDPDGTDHVMTRLSANDEVVENGWVIDDRIAYLAYNPTAGGYELNEITNQTAAPATTKTLLSGIEVYELLVDPRTSIESSCPAALQSATTRWFFNGLRFSDNQYITGAFDPDADDPSATLCTVSGITGQIETLVVVPST